MNSSLLLLLTGTCLVQFVLESQALSSETEELLTKTKDILRNELMKVNVDKLETDPSGLQQGIESFISKERNQIKAEDNGSTCACSGYTCGCCVHLEVEKVDLNDTVCVNFSYLPAPEYGVAVSLSVNNKTVYKKIVSVRNPPALCAGIPYLKKYASLCVKFEELQWTNKSLQGCVYILATLEGFEVEKVKLGCFKIPPGNDSLTAKPSDVYASLKNDDPFMLESLVHSASKSLTGKDVPVNWTQLKLKKQPFEMP